MLDVDGKTHEMLLDNYISNLKRKKWESNYVIAEKTVQLFRHFIDTIHWSTTIELLNQLREYGFQITSALPLQFIVGNIIRRILNIVREEYTAARKSSEEEIDVQDSLHKIVTSEDDVDDYNSIVPELKLSIFEHLDEFQIEIESSNEDISKQALEHIHSNEIILTVGKSSEVEMFLKEAAKDRTFEVFITECSPLNHGRQLALNLSKHKIQSTLIPDSTMFGIMSRVNKVIIGVDSVMANGGLRTFNGCHAVALAAAHYSVPVIVLAPMYKLSSRYLCSYNQDAFNEFVSPAGVLNYSDSVVSKVDVYNPTYDYVPPENVTLFISNNGGHSPSYVYRLLSEIYHPLDYDLSVHKK
ncbi:translation initiation factor eIF-2B subunit beta [Myzus persicae]|uniref:translation initiation factor eIF-2B subunit beta n=1 Tax=Myzus persicae TaxID=13164 RepID=UPI000B931EC4|nr:translation initiation factor eIF-2B subunit beta [Myzus persicae]XP_022168227.1 translation initiation factor eIF-2B subunit beta [Myzus persicae]XP_022168233.1 translation initiation factor eIF-2B subunit beta [Myzus persicae]XP_022168238.1 translation initiation factor eIF-2B subunit beta [Myzus persicae]XP_022168243.1 translation initiation factor eIF-2B subunit beta [Myzus persicae]XP_022168250.1 translation initiation factor eIF-2B subunit beta [Myzus persicae]